MNNKLVLAAHTSEPSVLNLIRRNFVTNGKVQFELYGKLELVFLAIAAQKDNDPYWVVIPEQEYLGWLSYRVFQYEKDEIIDGRHRYTAYFKDEHGIDISIVTFKCSSPYFGNDGGDCRFVASIKRKRRIIMRPGISISTYERNIEKRIKMAADFIENIRTGLRYDRHFIMTNEEYHMKLERLKESGYDVSDEVIEINDSVWSFETVVDDYKVTGRIFYPIGSTDQQRYFLALTRLDSGRSILAQKGFYDYVWEQKQLANTEVIA